MSENSAANAPAVAEFRSPRIRRMPRRVGSASAANTYSRSVAATAPSRMHQAVLNVAAECRTSRTHLTGAGRRRRDTRKLAGRCWGARSCTPAPGVLLDELVQSPLHFLVDQAGVDGLRWRLGIHRPDLRVDGVLQEERRRAADRAGGRDHVLEQVAVDRVVDATCAPQAR